MDASFHWTIRSCFVSACRLLGTIGSFGMEAREVDWCCFGSSSLVFMFGNMRIGDHDVVVWKYDGLTGAAQKSLELFRCREPDCQVVKTGWLVKQQVPIHDDFGIIRKKQPGFSESSRNSTYVFSGSKSYRKWGGRNNKNRGILLTWLFFVYSHAVCCIYLFI